MALLTKAALTDEMNGREKNNLEVAYRAACESVVMLKNNGALPFKGELVALYGKGASQTIKGGTGSGEVNERRSISILQGLENKNKRITTKKWIEDYDKLIAKGKTLKIKDKKSSEGGVAGLINSFMEVSQLPEGRAVTKDDIKKSATENCVYVVSRQAGEGHDRSAVKGDWYLTDRELEDIKFCSFNYKNFVLIINAGSGIDMSFLPETPDIDAILFISQLGTEGGRAVADILFGDVTPSGKLADTWVKSYSDLPFGADYSYLNGNLKEEQYKEGIYVGYRYFDSFNVEPLYPFGFGLSYAAFSTKSVAISYEEGKVSVTATVSNTSRKFSGSEVLQLYVSCPSGQLDKEYQSLAAFGKTENLKPGSGEKLTLSFCMENLASFSYGKSAFILEKGDYVLRLGNSSRCTEVIGAVRLPEEIIVSKHEHICPRNEAFEVLAAKPFPAPQIPEGKILTLSASDFKTESYCYVTPKSSGNEKVRRFVETLSPAEMIDVVVGAGMKDEKPFFNLPGSVGNTTSKFSGRGLANATFCDGPAGIRIQKLSAADDKGNVKPIEFAMGGYNKRLPEPVKQLLTGNVGTDKLLYQYTTAFPVASALANSWNTGLMYEVGCAVNEEMKEYGCVYWLAPAVNIHRNPLCGRNFEYFSEDPFLTGAMASAIIRGVQNADGYSATVKHFACNNQEDNRNKVNSCVTERALREIYLRAFKICVKQGGARSIMTSYNRLNGEYTANSYDLCTKVLRNEWGFRGVVMTDWFSTIVELGHSAACMRAGNDLIMPGEAISKTELRLALKTGKISLEDLRRCCCNVVAQLFESPLQREYINGK